MAIVLGKSDHYWYPVSVSIPVDAGKQAVIRFEARFARLGQARVSDLIERLRDESERLGDADLVAEVLTGWRRVEGVELESGDAPDYADLDQRAALLDLVGVQAGIVRAWFESITQGKRKN
jgi:hypothetical protein